MKDTKPTSMRQHKNKLLKADTKQRRLAFKRYCLEILLLLNKHKLTEERAAILIAGTMFLSNLDDDPQLQEIMHLAGQLEAPEFNTRMNWLKLRRLVDELATTYRL